MRNTNFERVYGGQNDHTVEIQGQKRHRHWPLKILSVVLAFLFWLIITNVNNVQSSQQQGSNSSSLEAGVCDVVALI